MGRETNFLKNHQDKREEERKNAKFVEIKWFFYFHLLTISYHGS